MALSLDIENRRQPFECGGFDAAFPFRNRLRNGKAASNPPHSKGCRRFLMSKLNAIARERPEHRSICILIDAPVAHAPRTVTLAYFSTYWRRSVLRTRRLL